MKWPPLSLLVVIAATWLASSAWRDHVAGRDGTLLVQRVQPGDIRMISSETCPYCLAARRWMTQQGIPFQECFIEREEKCLADGLPFGLKPERSRAALQILSGPPARLRFAPCSRPFWLQRGLLP